MKKITIGVLALILLVANLSDLKGQTYGGAYTVDGSYSEWNLTQDYFADMYRAFKDDKPVESKLYLHYDCQNHVMYALVLAQNPAIGLKQPSDAWITIDGISNKVVSGSTNDDGTAPDFSWIGVGFDGNTNHVLGYEASFPLSEGSYRIIAHIQVFDDGASQTSGTIKDNDGLALNVTCPVIPDLDLAVTKTVDLSAPMLDDQVTFVVTVTNLSATVHATQVEITDILPTGLDFVSATPSVGSYNSATGKWLIPQIPASGSVTLTMVADVKLVDPLCNEATLTGLDQTDTNSSNNSAEVCVDVPEIDLEVLKEVDNPEPDFNGVAVFTISVNNLTAALDATNVVIEDMLPTGLEYVSHTASSGSYDSNTGEWTIPVIPGNRTATLQISVKVTSDDPLCNSASLKSLDQYDNVIKNNESEACVDSKKKQVDIQVTKSVYNGVPQPGETSVFTITVKNNSPVEPATNVLISDLLPASFTLVSWSATTGSYTPSTGEWLIGSLAPAGSASLTIDVIAQASGDNTACLVSLDQEDIVDHNNCSTASITFSGSSGGNDGGLESDGSLAGLIALRNYNRTRSNDEADFKSAESMVRFSEQLASAGIIKAESILKGQSSLIQYLPETGPYKSQAFISTPTDLIGISNAREVFSLDYFGDDDRRYGAILALTTDGGEVYNHTKLICDRLMGASMDMAMNVTIRNKPFIMVKLVQDDGSVDYAVSFVGWKSGEKLLIDSRWHNEEYRPESGATVYNFQVWSLTPQTTIEMVEKILDKADSLTGVEFKNMDSRNIPWVRVIAGEYQNGELILKISNPNKASELTVKGKVTRTEQSARESIEKVIAIIPELKEQVVKIPVGSLYDADINIANNLDGFRDALYFADGSWGLDYTESGAVVSNFEILPQEDAATEEFRSVERAVSFTGKVKDYVSIFRGLKAGSRSVDLSGYNAILFDAAGTGTLEVVVTRKSISGWANQYRTRMILEPASKEYTIRFENLTSSGLGGAFSGEDVESVVFSLIGDGQSWVDMNLEVTNLKFGSVKADIQQLSMEDYRFQTYPNPFVSQLKLQFELPESGPVFMSLMDATGREIEVVANRNFGEGLNSVDLNTMSLDSGLYLVKMIYNEQQVVKRILKQ